MEQTDTRLTELDYLQRELRDCTRYLVLFYLPPCNNLARNVLTCCVPRLPPSLRLFRSFFYLLRILIFRRFIVLSPTLSSVLSFSAFSLLLFSFIYTCLSFPSCLFFLPIFFPISSLFPLFSLGRIYSYLLSFVLF